jgi:hypothetical protein
MRIDLSEVETWSEYLKVLWNIYNNPILNNPTSTQTPLTGFVGKEKRGDSLKGLALPIRTR